jgi:hypothetical protein
VGDTVDPLVPLGRVVFPTEAPQHCLTVVVTDLRTGDELTSEVCVASEPPVSYEADADLHWCIEPPSEGSAEAWCRLQFDQAPPECAAILAPGDAPGVAGMSGKDSSPVDVSDAAGKRTSQGCQLGISGPSSGGGAVAAVALLFAWCRRRRSLTNLVRARHARRRAGAAARVAANLP